jgi:hypothetical protein
MKTDLAEPRDVIKRSAYNLILAQRERVASQRASGSVRRYLRSLARGPGEDIAGAGVMRPIA